MKKNNLFAKEDFVEALLPHNRKEQFSFVFKTRKSLFLLLGLISLLFALPFLISNLVKNILISNAYILYEKESITIEEMFAFLQVHEFIFAGVLAASLIVISIFFAGLFNVYKNLVFGKPIFFKEQFFMGIKSNWKSFILITLVMDLFVIGLGALFRFFGFTFYFFIASGIFLLVVYPFLFNMYFYKSVYTASAKETIKNGLSLYLITNFKGLGLSLGFILIPLASNILADLMFITPIANGLINFVFFALLSPIYLYSQFTYLFSVFDEKINQIHFPNFYHVGLYNKNEKDSVKK